MPKYIQRRRERKEYNFFHGIEHKFCRGSCKKLKPLDQFAKKGNGKQPYCRDCSKKNNKQYDKQRLEQRKKARESAPSGFSVCLRERCTMKGLQPLDQFISPYVRNDKPTSYCQTCRNKMIEAQKRREAPCQKVWDDWRKTHPCVKCMNDPKYEHNYLLIEADHLGGKVTHCSDINYWSHSKRGVPALQAELEKCQALCVFHHRLQTQQRHRDNGRIQKKSWVLRKRAVINAEKYKRGCCLTCKRVLKKGEECAFDFDHRDPLTKFIRNGKPIGPSAFVELPQALFDTQWPIEKELVDLLCTNCHKLKTFANRDSYKK
tara:strand:+ start:5100 stop:6053 length:954 start_codon:yes stop_codon:yes gene_type:complete